MCGRVDYVDRGAVGAGTFENSLFLWHESVFILENIACTYSEHAGNWNASFLNHSYARIRHVDSGKIVVNVSATIGYGFVTPFVDEDFDTLWLFGSACDRCDDENDHGCVPGRAVMSWSAKASTMAGWTTRKAEGTVATYNVQVSRVRASAAEQASSGLPTHGYIMILEKSVQYMYNAATDGDLSMGWMAVPNAVWPAPRGGPSIRYSALDANYYVLLGGDTVRLFRTKDFQRWESPPQGNYPFIAPRAADGNISQIAGFTAQRAAERGFAPAMAGANFSKWDWNSNDGDVCCMTKNASSLYARSQAFVIWGAGTQGKKPGAPLTTEQSCANIIATAPMSLPALLAAHFKA